MKLESIPLLLLCIYAGRSQANLIMNGYAKEGQYHGTIPGGCFLGSCGAR